MKKVVISEKKIMGIREDTFRRIMSQYGIGLVLFVMIIIIGIMKPIFLSGNNILNIFTQISINCIIAYGMCLSITTGGIDLSVGSQIALASCILGQMMAKNGIDMWIAIPVSLLATTIMGFINGFMISKFKMFAFVVTLSTQLIIRSLAQIISEGQSQSMSGVTFKNIYSGKLFGIFPLPIIYMILIVIIMYIVMHWTKFGRYIFAVGGNENAAVASGVNVVMIRLVCYTLSGLLAGIAGVVFTAKTAASQANVGVGYETDAVAACVLGGTSFAGGIATAPGILIGSIIIGCISNGLNFLGVGSYYQSMAKGSEAGIGVICINTKTDHSDEVAMCFAGSSDTYAGEIMGNYVMEKIPDGGKYIHLQGIIGNSAQVLRGEGIANTIGKSDVWINAADVPCDWDQSKAVNAVDDYMTQIGDDLKAVICDNDQMAVAAQAECNTKGRSDILCIGVDGTDAALEMIANGTMLATVLQDGVGQVNAAVKALTTAINGEKYEKEYMVPFVLITSENLSDYYNK